MRARAPGKLVLSGAYAVLEGAPALVCAVDRYASADWDAPAAFVTAEVAAAIERGALGRAPAFDAAPLRAATAGVSRKLGLGSSAAILVASIGAALGAEGVGDDALAAEAFARALPAHRAAQGGGSGVDVAASAFGGVCRCQLDVAADAGARARAVGLPLAVEARSLPPGLAIEVYASRSEVQTRSMIGAVHGLRSARPERYAAWLERARAACAAVDRALATADARAFVAALDEQFSALATLGADAGVPIVTPAMAAAADVARAAGATLGPSGAGGGDVAIYVGLGPAPVALAACAAQHGLEPLVLAVGARGVHLVPEPVGAREGPFSSARGGP